LGSASAKPALALPQQQEQKGRHPDSSMTPIGGDVQEFSIDFPKQSHPYSIRNEYLKKEGRYQQILEERQI
jgi:hypothetical protein